MKQNQTSKVSLAEAVLGSFATGSICLWASLLTISTLLFIFKIPLGFYHLPIAALITLIFLFWYTSKTAGAYKIRAVIGALLIFAFLFGLSLWIASRVYDLSYDGQAYHQEAVIQLARGWNPIYMQLDGQATANLERWLNHYPKAVWIFAASVYKLTDNIESGKVLSLFVPQVAFAFSLWGMWKVRIKWLYKVVIALAFILNPVVIYQSLSYYVDGILVSMLLSLAFIGLRISEEGKSGKRKFIYLWPFLFTLIILLNIKLSSFVFAGILTFGIILYLWTRDYLRLSLSAIKFSFLGLIVGILFVGYNPYVTNFALKGHPLYPTMGKDALDYVAGNTPENLQHIASPLRLFMSLFSVSSLARGEGQYAEFKIPFQVSSKELDTFRETNAKTGGFGPLFSGVFVFAAVSSVFYFTFSDKSREYKLTLLTILGLILGSAGMVSTNSVARFVPYVWWAPCVLVHFYFLEKQRITTIVGVIISLMMFINTAVVAKAYIPYNVSESGALEEELTQIAYGKYSEPIVIDVGLFGSTKLKLKKFDIAYIEVPQETVCKSRKRILTHNVSEMCEL